MAAWLEALAAAERDGEAAVLVTVLSAKGSTPREAGAKMVVSADGIAGSIGGGNLEFQCEAAARAMLIAGVGGPQTRDFPLGPALGQCCGGHVTVLFEVFPLTAMHVAVFGAGHVGKALIKLLGDLPCRVTWIDSRLEALPAQLPGNVIANRHSQPAVAASGLPSDTAVLVMTHDHQLDFDIVATCLGRDDLRFVGLIGSDTKRARFVSRLARLGLPADRMVCPIGVPGITGKQPAVIAVSVAAQILQLLSTSGQPVRSETPMPATPLPAPVRSCGDCVCPPVPGATR